MRARGGERSAELCLGKRAALAGYYLATLPCRAWSNRRRAAAGRAPVMVLFYHRIADHLPNDWTASTRTFRRQIDWLQRHFDLVSLEQAQDRLRSGCNPRPAVSITFDDGYADNCDQALPLLIRRRIPCTYFVTSLNVLRDEPYPHDVARGVRLRPNTPDQIRRLADAGIEIGCHTRRHADLGRVSDPQVLEDELLGAREELSQWIDRPIRYFAFPYGQHVNLSNAAFALARQAGYLGVCSAYGGYNFPGDDAFHLQRIHADNDLIRLKNWLTVDPRKLRQVRRFVPAAVPCPELELAT